MLPHLILLAALAAPTPEIKVDEVGCLKPAGVTTGEYGDRDCADERPWAAAELSRFTGEKACPSCFPAHHAEHRNSVRVGALPPARMYPDEEDPHATNEIAIKGNASLVFLLAGALRPA
jgi:hypothetical protein